MTRSAIAIEHLSKRYLIGHKLLQPGAYKYTALRDVIEREISNFLRKAGDVFHGRQVVQGDQVDAFWALKDVSFTVQQGECVGIVGRNGAGKSTLLKLLSRITEPTAGRIVLSGSVASLLEVGTGFHPELTGRENIFLNGAILGMTRRDVKRKFDEIVAFAEVNQFLDTPVKYYSSGMYVRLAFAVAAHLEPEILVVDEVLAVGDYEFQKKCLGKMDEVSRKEGRTVLFVSHNMDAILRLCNRAVHIEGGTIRAIGDTNSVVSAFLQHEAACFSGPIDLSCLPRPSNSLGKARLVKVSPANAQSTWSIPFGEAVSFNLSIDVQPAVSRIEVAIALSSSRGFDIAAWTNKCSNIELYVKPGVNTFHVVFQHVRLLPDQYLITFGVRDDRGGDDFLLDALSFEVLPSSEGAKISAELFRGHLVLPAMITAVD